jgi:hypothetical protein
MTCATESPLARARGKVFLYASCASYASSAHVPLSCFRAPLSRLTVGKPRHRKAPVHPPARRAREVGRREVALVSVAPVFELEARSVERAG